MRRRLLLVVLGIVVVVASAVAFIVWPRGVDPVPLSEALQDYRSGTQTSDPSGAAIDDDGVSRPRPGVYPFGATGQEEVQAGILPTETRSYPATVPVTVVADGATCFTVTVDLFVQHTEDTRYCITDTGALRLDRHRKHQQIGALRPDAEMTCDPGVLSAPDRRDEKVGCSMAISAGPVSLTAELAGVARSEPTSIVVDGRTIDAVRIVLRYTVSGDLSGTWDEQLWLARDDWLPLRITRDLDLRGLAAFEEHSVLTLASTEPDQ